MIPNISIHHYNELDIESLLIFTAHISRAELWKGNITQSGGSV